jgi:hypothetical protein
MIARVAFGGALMLAAAGYSGTLAQPRTASDALLGRWDLVVQRGAQTSPSWLEVERSGTATLVGQFVGSGGSARPIARIEFTDGDATRSEVMLAATGGAWKRRGSP